MFSFCRGLQSHSAFCPKLENNSYIYFGWFYVIMGELVQFSTLFCNGKIWKSLQFGGSFLKYSKEQLNYYFHSLSILSLHFLPSTFQQPRCTERNGSKAFLSFGQRMTSKITRVQPQCMSSLFLLICNYIVNLYWVLLISGLSLLFHLTLIPLVIR